MKNGVFFEKTLDCKPCLQLILKINQSCLKGVHGMTIKEVEERTSLSRSNIRFYEKEKLIEPSRNESNGYRDYSENDVENIKKIAYLRTLGISIEDIRSIISEKITLQETLEKQNEVLKSQIIDLNKAKLMCEKMLDEESISYEKLQVEQYVTELQDYWKDNQAVFKLDSVSFLYIWGSMLTWTTITALCLIIGGLFYSKLPTEIPVQWSNGVATSLVNKNWIFICPVICIIIRYMLKPFIYVKLQMSNYYGEVITEYLTNYMCFIVLSIEIFSILFTFGVVKSIVMLLFVDTVVFIGLLVVGLAKMDLRGKEFLQILKFSTKFPLYIM